MQVFHCFGLMPFLTFLKTAELTSWICTVQILTDSQGILGNIDISLDLEVSPSTCRNANTRCAGFFSFVPRITSDSLSPDYSTFVFYYTIVSSKHCPKQKVSYTAWNLEILPLEIHAFLVKTKGCRQVKSPCRSCEKESICFMLSRTISVRVGKKQLPLKERKHFGIS